MYSNVLFAVLLLMLSQTRSQEYEKLIDGQQTDISKYPYQVAVLFAGKLTCGGSIIDKRWILTAAHCTFNRPIEGFSIRAGSSVTISGGQEIAVKKAHEHPKFSFSTIDYDIALLHLTEDLEFTENVTSIKLAKEEPIVGALATVTGWGIVANGLPFTSQVIRAVEVPIVRRFTCNLRYFFKVTDRMLCAGYTFGGKNICKGDSGGPLVYQGEQIGIVSWAAGCARPISPGVFTNVPALLDFIKNTSALTKI